MTEASDTIDRVTAICSRLRSAALLPGDAEYMAVMCRLWYRKITHLPALIVRCKSDDEVAVALRLAKDVGMPLALDGEVHLEGVGCDCIGGLLVDTSGMRDVVIDAIAGRAVCGTGATWSDLDRATRELTPVLRGSFIGDAEIAGLSIGEGFGWATPVSWWACDNLVALQIVTTAGEHLRATLHENGEAFAKFRNGHGSCTSGAVTAFELSLNTGATTRQGTR